MTTTLPQRAIELLDAPSYVVLATLNADGGPQTSVVWATRDGNDVLVSTTLGRAKERNLRRDPRVSALILDRTDDFSYVEVRGTAQLIDDPAGELIQTLSQLYTGGPYTADEGTGNIRVIVRITPQHVVVF